MNVRRSTRSALRPGSLATSLISSLLLLPAILSAQTVTAPGINGVVSLTGPTPIYFGQYVATRMDYGINWLDTTNLTAGFIAAVGKCAPGVPQPVTNRFIYLDCNGTQGFGSDGTHVVVDLYQSNCASLRVGTCDIHAPVEVHGALGFTVGTWAWDPNWTTQIPDGTGTASTDPEGRTWSVSCTLPQNPPVVCTWTASGNPNAPPTNNASATNNSAASRTDKTNYFGDLWTITDTSASIATISQAQWDLRYFSSGFSPDASLTQNNPPTAIPGEKPGSVASFPFPCDPTGVPAGDITTGANCWASVGSPTTTGQYQFALQDANSHGTSAPFVSSSISVSAPQIFINGSTSASSPTLQILTGGTANASATQGSPTSWAWTFTPSGGGNTASVAVPLGTTNYSLTVNYAGGYTVTLGGNVVQTDLVPGFTLSPNPVLVGPPPEQITLTNTMQKSTAATLNSVDWLIGASACDGRTSIATNPLPTPNTFVQQTAGGTAQVTGPSTQGSYCMYLQYNFTGSNGAQSLVAALPFTATNWAPTPSIGISPAPFCIAGCQITTGTTYTLSDTENIPITPHPGAQWDLISTSTTSIGTASDANTAISWTPSAVCASCTLKLTVAGVSTTLPVTISNPTGPPPTNPTVSLSGPSSLNVNQTGTFVATVSNANGSVTYTWVFDDAPFTPITGGASMAHAWSGNGSHAATVSITASNGNASATWHVNVIGNPAPSGSFTVTPSQQNGTTYTVGRGQVITFTAAEINASQWGWVFGDGTLAGGPSARSVQKAYSALGTYSGQLLVYGDTTHTILGPTIVNFTIVVSVPLPSTAFTVNGASQDPLSGKYTSEVGRTMVFTASETNASSYSWNFGDGTTAPGPTVTKTYTAAGTFTVQLTVTGDGVNNSGTSTGSSPITINPSTFRAAIVPGVAHLDDGNTTWGTDVSITNAGSGPTNINLAFIPLVPDAQAAPTLDLTQLSYAGTVALGVGGSYSVPDVVSALGGGNNKGTLVIKYTGGSEAPLVSTRVYFQPDVNPNSISYGSGLPTYQVDASGRIVAQGFVSVALEGATPSGITPSAVEAVEDLSLTVTLAGTGSGTVTSVPAAIDCPTTCSATFPVGTLVQLSGQPASGSTFVGIAGCDSYPVGECTMTMGTAKTVTATFNSSGPPPPPPGNNTLTVSKTGTGTGTVSSNPSGISCGATCSATFTQGTSVTLSATPDSGSTFAGWGSPCSGTGSCVVTMSASASVSATFNTTASAPQGDQVLIGLRSDPGYRFGVTLFNASGATGTFRLTAMDEDSSPLLIDDGVGGVQNVAFRDFTIHPYQQVYLTNDNLGLSDATKRYVLKGTRTSTTGTLLAFGTALDKRTNDFLQVADDGQASAADAGIVSYWVAGVSHFNSGAAHWRTDLRVYNRGSHARNLYFDYTFSQDGVTDHLAHVSSVPIAAGQLLTYDDVIGTLLSQDTSVNLTGSTAGVLRIYYPQDTDSDTRPLVIGSRNYDDETTGTAGSQLAVYTSAQTASAGQALALAGAEESDHYSSRIGVFTMDPGPVTGEISALAADGTVVGHVGFTLGGSGTHFGQLSLTDPNMGFANPGTPVSIRIDQINGGRVAAYAFTVDKATLDTVFIQGLLSQ